MPNYVKTIWSVCWYIIVTGLVLAAVLLGVARVLLPMAEDYRLQAQEWVGKFINQPVHIESLDADWQGYEPQLVLRGVSFISKENGEPSLEFIAAKIGINLFSSLMTRQLQPGTLVVVGADLKVVREEDGSFSIGALKTEAHAAGSASTGNRGLGKWLFERDVLRIEQSQLVWEDRIMGWGEKSFRVSELVLKNDDEMHHLSGSIGLPTELGKELQFSAELLGSPFAGNDWHGSAYLHAADIQLDGWLPDQSKDKWQLINGRASLNAWSEWRNGRMDKTYGSIALKQLFVFNPNSANLLSYDSLASDFSFTHDGGLWRVLLNDFTITSRQREWPESAMVISYDTGKQHLVAKASHLDLAYAGELLLISNVLSPTQAKTFSQSAVSGALNNVQLYYDRDAGHANYQVQAQLNHFASRVNGKLPGLKNLSGNLQLDSEGGVFNINSQQLQLDYPHYFDHSIRADLAQGKVSWRYGTEQSQLHFSNLHLWNKEVDASLQGGVTLRAKAKPFIDLHVALNKPVELPQATDYLPVGILPEGTVKWVRNGLQGGQAQGSFTMYGDMADFPFRDGEGKFELLLDVQKGLLNYRDDWPLISDIDGRFVLNATGLSFQSKQARLFDTRLRDVSVLLPDFAVGKLQVRGRAQGRSSDKLRYLHESPLQELFARHIETLQLTGNSDLFIDLAIPLKPEAGQLQVNGYVDFDKNRFKADAWKLEVKNFDGRLRFDHHGIYAERIKGSLGGVLPLQLAADTREEDGVRTIYINHAGRFDAGQLKYALDHFAGQKQLASWFTGSSDLLAQVTIPVSGEQAGKAVVQLTSPMQGMLVDLPAPLKKNGEEQRDFLFRFHALADRPLLEFQYDNVYALLELQLAAGEASVNRGAVGFGQEVKLPDEYGYRIVGALDHFSWSEWRSLLLPDPGEVGLLHSSGGIAASIFFNLKVTELELYGLKFRDVAAQASNSAQGWSVSVDGPQLKGDMFIPLVMRSAPLVMNMDKIIVNLEQVEKGETGKLHPAQMPEFRITSNDFRYNDIKFGQLILNTRRTDEGMMLDTLTMKTSTTLISAKGDWIEQQAGQHSRFDIVVDSDSLGQSLSDWGYAETIAKGKTHMTINASWPGTPTDFRFKYLTGTAQMDVSDGRLLDVKPGAARLFGLLSVQTLPRRLILDFSDVFAKGMQFDTLKGEFKIENGVAFTSGLAMDGPAVAIDMAGKIDLAEGEYDQVVTIVPKVGASIPLLGALTVAPQVGATLFLLQKVFEKQIDEVSTIQYSVQGPWEQPVIEKIERPPVNVQPEILE